MAGGRRRATSWKDRIKEEGPCDCGLDAVGGRAQRRSTELCQQGRANNGKLKQVRPRTCKFARRCNIARKPCDGDASCNESVFCAMLVREVTKNSRFGSMVRDATQGLNVSLLDLTDSGTISPDGLFSGKFKFEDPRNLEMLLLIDSTL